MGIYLNPSADGFASIMKTGDYVDKTGLITYMNAVLNSSRNMLCSSRPRRFGKSYAAQMLSAFYSKGADARELFAHLRVANPPEETKEKEKEWYNKYRNNCDVLFWDMAWFISNAQNIGMPVILYRPKENVNEIEWLQTEKGKCPVITHFSQFFEAEKML